MKFLRKDLTKFIYFTLTLEEGNIFPTTKYYCGDFSKGEDIIQHIEVPLLKVVKSYDGKLAQSLFCHYCWLPMSMCALFFLSCIEFWVLPKWYEGDRNKYRKGADWLQICNFSFIGYFLGWSTNIWDRNYFSFPDYLLVLCPPSPPDTHANTVTSRLVTILVRKITKNIGNPWKNIRNIKG